MTGEGSPPARPDGAGDDASPCREKKKLSWDTTFQLNREMGIKLQHYYLHCLENNKKRIFPTIL